MSVAKGNLVKHSFFYRTAGFCQVDSFNLEIDDLPPAEAAERLGLPETQLESESNDV